MSSSADASPSVTPSSTPLSGTHAPKYGTVIPNRIFVGGIAANTSELELKQFFTTYGAVKDSKIIADRAGVSKGYGFITFENQEDADRIIKKESDNLVFKDRKLNIGPAVRKQVTSQDQVMPRTFGVDSLSSDTIDASLPAGTVLLANGVPYTYQNGMAIFHAPEGGYPIAQPQISTPSYSAMMVPQTPTMYIAPQYSAYQPSTPQWTSPSGQWRWAQQSPQQAVTGSPYIYATTMHASPELMYAQPPPHAYQPTELTESTIMPDTQQTVEGNVLQKTLEQSYLATHGFVTESEAEYTTTSASFSSVNSQPITVPVSPAAMGGSEQPKQNPLPLSVVSPQFLSGSGPLGLPAGVLSYPAVTASNMSAGVVSYPSVSASVAPYHKKGSNTTIPRRPYSSPTILVKHGHKVQRVMMPAKAVTPNGQLTYIRAECGAGDMTEAIARHTILTPPPTPDTK